MAGPQIVGTPYHGRTLVPKYGFQHLQVLVDSGFPDIFITFPFGVINVLHNSCPRTMQGGLIPLKMNPMTAWMISNFIELQIFNRHLDWAKWRKQQSSGRRKTSLLLMYIGSMLYSMFNVEKGIVGALGQCTYWTKTMLKPKNKNRCLTSLIGVGKIGGTAMPCCMWWGDERGGATTLCSVPSEDKQGGSYIMLGPFHTLFKQKHKTMRQIVHERKTNAYWKPWKGGEKPIFTHGNWEHTHAHTHTHRRRQNECFGKTISIYNWSKIQVEWVVQKFLSHVLKKLIPYHWCNISIASWSRILAGRGGQGEGEDTHDTIAH